MHISEPSSLQLSEREVPGESYSLAEWVTGLEPDGEDASPEDDQTTEPQRGTEQPTAAAREAEPAPAVHAEFEDRAEHGSSEEVDRSTDLLEQALDPSLEHRRALRHSLRSHCALQRLSLMRFDFTPTFLVRECVLDPNVLEQEGAEAQPVLTDSLEMEPLDASALPEQIYHSLCHIVGPSMLEQVFVLPGSMGEQWMQDEQAVEQEAQADVAQVPDTTEPQGSGQDRDGQEDVEAAKAEEPEVVDEAAAADEAATDGPSGEAPQPSASDAEDEAEVEASADLREEHEAGLAPQEAEPAPRESASASPPPVRRHNALSTYESRIRRRRQQPRRSSARLQQKQPPVPEPPTPQPPAPKATRSRKRKAAAEEPTEPAPMRLRSRRERKPRRPFSPGP